MLTRFICNALLVVVGSMLTFGCSQFASRNTSPGPVMTPEGVKFRYYDPGASRVQLAGNWPENNWARGDGSVGEANIGLMTRDSDGVWEIVVPLEPGRYLYLFWSNDTTWSLDPGNPVEVRGGPRSTASQLIIFLSDDKMEIR
jgi:1,4-alpha-glucan branching enzyme